LVFGIGIAIIAFAIIVVAHIGYTTLQKTIKHTDLLEKLGKDEIGT
jgi:hypothetical protein